MQEDHGGAVHRAIHAVRHLIEDHAEKAGLPVWFAASKLIEGDKLILEQLDLDQNEKEMLEHIVLQMENERGLDRSAAIADMRFFLTFNVIGAWLQDLLAMGIEWLTGVDATHALTAANINEAIHGLIIEGIFEGVGSVLASFRSSSPCSSSCPSWRTADISPG